MSALSLQVSTRHYTTLTDFSMKYLVICKVYTDVGGINSYTILKLKLVDYLHVQRDKPWYNYYVKSSREITTN